MGITMNQKLFLDENPMPTNALMNQALGDRFKYLQQIRFFLDKHIGSTTEEWKYYGKKNGWTIKTFLKKRNLFFTTIHAGHFRITFVFVSQN
jgi:hypothetical protein